MTAVDVLLCTDVYLKEWLEEEVVSRRKVNENQATKSLWETQTDLVSDVHVFTG